MKQIKCKTPSGLEYYQISPENTADKAIIFLHGLGASYQDFIFLPDLLKNQTSDNWLVILPNAKDKAITVNGGFEMPAWYDITSMDLTNKDDMDGINESVSSVIEIIKAVKKQGVDEKDIFLGGFSQGGVISLATLIKYDGQIAGVIGLSTYLARSIKITQTPKTTAVFMGHGKSDPVVNIIYGEKSKQQLKDVGCNVAWHQYNMEHSVNEQELEDMVEWINEQ